MSTGEIKFAPEGRILLAEIRFAAGQDLVDARALYPDALDWTQATSAPAITIPDGALGVAYRLELVDGRLVYPNTPATVTGVADLTTVTYGSLGPLAGKSFSMQVDGGDPVTVTFGSAGAAPANAAAVVARINAAYGSAIAALDAGHHLVLTGVVTGPGAFISIFEDTAPGALEVFGITQFVYRTSLDGLIDLSGFASEPQENFPLTVPIVSNPADSLLTTSGAQLNVTATPSNVDPATLIGGHLLVRVLFMLPAKL